MKRIFQMYGGLRKEVYILCFGRFVTAMGSLIWPMLTLILKSKLGFKTLEWAKKHYPIGTMCVKYIPSEYSEAINTAKEITLITYVTSETECPPTTPPITNLAKIGAKRKIIKKGTAMIQTSIQDGTKVRKKLKSKLQIRPGLRFKI